MSKKVIITCVIILLLIVMLIPKKDELLDGGSVVYKAVLYKYTKIHRFSEINPSAYEEGWELQLLGIHFSNIKELEEIPKSIKVIKSDTQDSNKFNKYLEKEDRIFYLSSNIKQVKYTINKDTFDLDYYINNANQTLDESIDELTSLLENTITFKDGGTKVFKSKEYDITIIKCNRIMGSKDIFIGDYNMNYNNDIMCYSNEQHEKG